jgi:hypothetical protein
VSDVAANIALITTLVERYNKGDAHGVAALFAAGCAEYAHPGSLLREGPQAIADNYVKVFAEFPQNHAEVLHRSAFNDKVIDHERVRRSPTRRDHSHRLCEVMMAHTQNPPLQGEVAACSADGGVAPFVAVTPLRFATLSTSPFRGGSPSVVTPAKAGVQLLRSAVKQFTKPVISAFAGLIALLFTNELHAFEPARPSPEIEFQLGLELMIAATSQSALAEPLRCRNFYIEAADNSLKTRSFLKFGKFVRGIQKATKSFSTNHKIIAIDYKMRVATVQSNFLGPERSTIVTKWFYLMKPEDEYYYPEFICIKKMNFQVSQMSEVRIYG